MRKTLGFLVIVAIIFCGGSPVIGQGKDNIDDIVRKFKTSDKATDRALAMSILGTQGEKARGVTKTLVEGLLDPSPDVQKSAKYSIGLVNPAVAGPVVSLVTGETYDARLAGLLNLSKLGPEGLPALPALLAFLRQAKPDDRGKVVLALADVGTKDQQMAAMIANMALRDPDPLIRAAALKALPKMDFAKDQVSLFLRALEEKDPKVRTIGVQALGTIGKNNPSVIRALESISKTDLDPGMREEAKKALALAQGKS